MKKMRCAVSVVMLAAGAVQAEVVSANLGLPPAGNYPDASATAVLTSQSYHGATFDIAYTLGSISISNNPFVNSTGSQLGVGSDGDSSLHYSTLEANDGEGISFTGLSIVNFAANESALTVDDISGLKFTSISFNNAGNTADRVLVSFTDFTTPEAQLLVNINTTGEPTPTIDLTSLSNYGSSPTALYVNPNGTSSTNRWAVTGLGVTYSIPEPATLGMVAASAGGLMIIRRRFMM